MSDKPEPDTTPLCVATMKQIATEIERRHQGYVLVTVKTENGEEECEHSHGGGFTLALGLLRRAANYLESGITPRWTNWTKIKTTDGDDDAPWRGEKQ